MNARNFSYHIAALFQSHSFSDDRPFRAAIV